MAFTPTEEQQTVLNRHNYDIALADTFILNHWPQNAEHETHVDQDKMVFYTVSTTLETTFLLLSAGIRTNFTRNTYSANVNHPWLISSLMVDNPNTNLATDINFWFSSQIPNFDPQLANILAPFMIFELNRVDIGRTAWRSVLLNADEQNILARFEDVTIWIHPPRDKPLNNVLENEHVNGVKFLQYHGNLLSQMRALNKLYIDANPRITEQSKEDKKNVVREMFNNLHKVYKRVQLPNSYKWPTLQLEYGNQRYGETFAGVYDAHSNEVHHPFPAAGVEARQRPNWTQRDMWTELRILARFGEEVSIQLEYGNMFQVNYR